MAERELRLPGRARDEHDEPVFLLKGGVAMELRLQLKARATRDYDAAFRPHVGDVLDLLDEAFGYPYNNFAVTRDKAEPIGDTGAIRLRLRLSYKGRTWASVKLELAPVEGAMGNELDRVESAPIDGLRVPVPKKVNCVSVRYQVAQKLHACTEVFDKGRANERFRDVMDILLVEDRLRNEVGLVAVREACIDIFATRDKHPWPPRITVYESWRTPFRALADGNGFTPDDIDTAAERLRQLITDIDAHRA